MNKKTYTHKGGKRSKNAQHWKKVREQEWLDSYDLQEDQEELEDIHPYVYSLCLPVWNRSCNSWDLADLIKEETAKLDPEYRYIVRGCLNVWRSAPSQEYWSNWKELVDRLHQVYHKLPLAQYILNKVAELDPKPWWTVTELANMLVAGQRLSIHYLAAKSKCAYKGRSGNSPYQPNFISFEKLYEANSRLPVWMYPILLRVYDSVDFKDYRKIIQLESLPEEKVLFDCCKAWKVFPCFPKKIAIRVGRLPLWKRLVAGEVMKELLTEWHGLKISGDFRAYYFIEGADWHSPETLNEFWKRFSSRTRQGKFSCIESLASTQTNKKRLLEDLAPKCLSEDMKAYLIKDRSFIHQSLIGVKSKTLSFVIDKAIESYCGQEKLIFHLLPCIIASVNIFGNNVKQYLEKYARFSTSSDKFHDAIQWLDISGSQTSLKGLDSFIMKWINMNQSDLSTIAKAWSRLDDETKSSKSFNYVLAKARMLRFETVLSEEFGAEAAYWAVDPDDYSEYEQLYLESLEVPTPFDTNWRLCKENYTARFLPRKDVRVGFFGHYTNCCQHYEGVGSECAESSVKDSFSQLFVIEDSQGLIVAGSWVWVNKSGVCFDNIEAKNVTSKQEDIFLAIYKDTAAYLVKQGFDKVTVGTCYSSLNLKSLPKTKSLKCPINVYSDADEQRLLAVNNDN